MKVETGPSRSIGHVPTMSSTKGIGVGRIGALEGTRTASISITKPSVDFAGGSRFQGSFKSLLSETKPITQVHIDPLNRLPTRSELAGLKSEIFSPKSPVPTFAPETKVPQHLVKTILSGTAEHKIVNPPSADRLPSKSELSQFTVELFSRSSAAKIGSPPVENAKTKQEESAPIGTVPKEQSVSQEFSVKQESALIQATGAQFLNPFEVSLQKNIEQARRTLNAFSAIDFPKQQAEQIVVRALKSHHPEARFALFPATPEPSTIKVDKAQKRDSETLAYTAQSKKPELQEQKSEVFAIPQQRPLPPFSSPAEKRARKSSQLELQKPIFERDTDADRHRWKEALNAATRLFWRSRSLGEVITGKEISQEMPGEPQPTLLKSRIRQKTLLPDGSYTNVVENVSEVGKVPSIQQAIANPKQTGLDFSHFQR